MKNAKQDSDSEHLKTIYKPGFMNTDIEEPLERLTRLAKQFFSVPIVLVSYLHNNSQRFKSCQGLEVREIEHELFFCRYTLLTDGIFEVIDASVDFRFANHSMVIGSPYIRSYAGVALSYGESCIGTFCIIDNKPRRLSFTEQQALRDFASCVETVISPNSQSQTQVIHKAEMLGKVIVRAQSRFIREEDHRSKAFDGLLEDILDITDSEYGFIGEVLYSNDGKPYLKTYSITNIAWNASTRDFFQANAPEGMEFNNLNTLFGAVITSGEPVIANDPYNDSRRGGLPEGHPAMTSFLGLPVFYGNELVAMLGIANRAEGYDQTLIDFMQPLTATLGQLVGAARIKKRQRDDERRLSSVIESTHVGIWEWNVQTGNIVLNEHWAEIVGYSLQELQPVNVQTWLDLVHPDDIKQSADILESHLSGGSDYYEAQYRMRHKQGHWVWVFDRGRVMNWIDKKKPLLMFGTHTDITEQIMMNEAIHKQRWVFEQILEQSMAGYWDWMIQQGTEYLSPRFKSMFGYEDHEIDNLPESWHSLILRDDLPGVLACYEQHIKSRGQVPFDNTVRYWHKNGSTVWVRCIGKVIEWSEDGQPIRMVGSHIDITDHKLAEQALKISESRLRGLFQLSPIGIALNDYETGLFIDLNDALLAPTGYTREEFTALTYMDLTPQEYTNKEAEQRIKIEKTGRYGPFEKEYIRKDGSRYPVLLNGMLVKDRSGRKLIWSMIEDISERKHIERMKNEFVSTVSHELRTPLTSISGALGLLVGNALGELPVQVQQMLDIAYKNCQRLTHLINDLLDMEKIAAGKLHVEMQVQLLMPLIEQALEMNRTYGADREVRMLLNEGSVTNATVRVDAPRLIQVLTNLLSNAVKFSPKGDTVHVIVETLENKVIISVVDNGPGIPDSFRDYIFSKFSQADASDLRQQGGTGLGLAISRELVERMEGSIGFDSVNEQGATFWIKLPLVLSDNS